MHDNGQNNSQIQISNASRSLSDWQQFAHRLGANPFAHPTYMAPALLTSLGAISLGDSRDLYRIVMPKGVSGDLMTLSKGDLAGLHTTSVMNPSGKGIAGTAGLEKVNAQQMFWPKVLLQTMLSHVSAQLNALHQGQEEIRRRQVLGDYAKLERIKHVISSVASEYSFSANSTSWRERSLDRLMLASDDCYELLCVLQSEMHTQAMDHNGQYSYSRHGIDDKGIGWLIKHPVFDAFGQFVLGKVCHYALLENRSVEAIREFKKMATDLAKKIYSSLDVRLNFQQYVYQDYLRELESCKKGWSDIPIDLAELNVARAKAVIEKSKENLYMALWSKLDVFDILENISLRDGPVQIALFSDGIIITDVPAPAPEQEAVTPGAEEIAQKIPHEGCIPDPVINAEVMAQAQTRPMQGMG